MDDRAISKAPELSSNSWQCTLGVLHGISNPAAFNSLIKRIKGIISRSAVLKEMYSLSVVDSAISVCNFEAHTSGKPAYIITCPDLDLAVELSCSAISGSQSPAKPASA